MAGCAPPGGASGMSWICPDVMGADVEAARARAYGNLARVHFDGLQARTDIGQPVSAGVPS